MIESFASRIQARQGTGPAGLMTGTYELTTSGVVMNRRALTGIMRRDPWRSSADNRPIISAMGLTIANDVGDGEAFEFICDAIADPGRGTDVSGTRTWKVGRPADVRRFDFALLPVEGGELELREAALVQAQIVLERGRLVTLFSEWEGRQLTTDHDEWTAEDISSTNYAGSLHASVDFGGSTLPVFSCALAITRDLAAAQFGLDGVARAWRGSLTPDVVGRLALRVPVGEFASLIAGGTTEKELTLTITTPGKVRTIHLPQCVCEIGERQLVGKGTYEHLVEFALLRESGEDAMTITSEAI